MKRPTNKEFNAVWDMRAADLKSMLKSGLSFRQIAEKYNCKHNTVSSHVKRLGLSSLLMTQKKKSEVLWLDRQDEICLLRSMGWSTQDIAIKYKCWPSTVARQLRGALMPVDVKVSTKWVGLSPLERADLA